MTRTELAHDPHNRDRLFLRWVQDPATLSADLRAKWHEICDVGWWPEAWRLRAIERELRRRGELEPIYEF